jgi:hypothetical protein
MIAANINMYSFDIINPSMSDWKLIESAFDSTCFQTRQWCDFLRKIGKRLFILSVKGESETIGYFVGVRAWIGISAVLAPTWATGTYTQGLTMLKETPEEQRVCIYLEMYAWLRAKRIASYFKVDDWHLRRDYPKWVPVSDFHQEMLDKYNIRYSCRPTLHVDVSVPLDDLWAGLHYKSCKYCINKARKNGLKIRVIENREDIKSFVEIHHAHLVDVCKGKGMRPRLAQGKSRMKVLCEALFPNRILMIEVFGKVDQKEVIMSSGIFGIDKGESIYWTGASFMKYQKYCPNELMVWEAMCILHERGAGDLNFGGMAHYKLKFGTEYAYVPSFVLTKYKWLHPLLHLMKKMIDKVHFSLGDIVKKMKNKIK